MVLTGSHDDHDAMIGKGIFSILDDLQHVYHVNAKITGEIQNTLERLRMPRNHR
ncbi:unnamed protein product [Orchesella dallaii]|uniref:Uncharacterized protein n=1 Tax=Orchesella dallaii TaxID=48710 RepID=A0ABP1QIV5_9HEXA